MIYNTHVCFLCGWIWHEGRRRRQNFCDGCKANHPDYALAPRFLVQIRRAKKAGLPATATLAGWKQTITHFNGMCAYCQKRPFVYIEHYIPISLGGGTTNENILPACKSCNWRKVNNRPHQILRPQVRQRVEAWLYTPKSEEKARTA